MSDCIRVRTCLVVVEDERILLVTHYDREDGTIQWTAPGGRVEYDETIPDAALREFTEETGLTAEITDLFNVSEVLLPERPYHSVTIAYRGRVTGGTLQPEDHRIYGKREARWMSADDLQDEAYHPPTIIRQALNMVD